MKNDDGDGLRMRIENMVRYELI